MNVHEQVCWATIVTISCALIPLLFGTSWLAVIKRLLRGRSPSPSTPFISSLVVYPVKGCGGMAVKSAKLLPTGLLYDRHWMVVREDSGKFISQREESKLALVTTAIPHSVLAPTQPNSTAPPPGADLVLFYPGLWNLKVSLTPPAGPPKLKTVTVWEWTGPAVDEGDKAAAWFSGVVGYPARLVRFLDKDSAAAATTGTVATRPLDKEFAVGGETEFTDGFPLLMASEAGLADLNARLAKPLPMKQFRPNIVVGGSPAWWEDSFRSVRVLPKGGAAAAADAIEFTSVKPCARCKVTTIDQATGVVHSAQPNTLDSLAEFRSGKQLGWSEQQKSWTHSVFFGTNLVTTSSGILRVGDGLQSLGPQLATLAPAILA